MITKLCANASNTKVLESYPEALYILCQHLYNEVLSNAASRAAHRPSIGLPAPRPPPPFGLTPRPADTSLSTYPPGQQLLQRQVSLLIKLIQLLHRVMKWHELRVQLSAQVLQASWSQVQAKSKLPITS